jgi:twitching motility protein PilT
MARDYTTEIQKYMTIVSSQGGSDLHLSVSSRPTIRVDGSLTTLLSEPILTKDDCVGFLKVITTADQFTLFNSRQELDFSFSFEGSDRFRCNAFIQQGSVAIVMRRIPKIIRSLEDLKLPPVLSNFARRKQGFFLVVGPVGQGKTTTLAALLDIVNTERPAHIVTIEDPVEYLHTPKQALIDQREVGVDTHDFQTALKSAFRQDIDVLMVGEMRGHETMSAAVTAAETGHLVFSTLHTNNAAQTIDRIIDTFPAEQQDQIRLQLSASLAGIFSQRLIPRLSGGMVPAYELLINNKAVANLIRERRTHEINTLIETGTDEGMIDMNRTLAELVSRSEISIESAYAHAFNPQMLEKLI